MSRSTRRLSARSQDAGQDEERVASSWSYFPDLAQTITGYTLWEKELRALVFAFVYAYEKIVSPLVIIVRL